MIIREFQPGDEEGIVSTVREVFDAYGFTWDADGYCADLYDPQSNYVAVDGRFWVAEQDSTIVACVAYLPHRMTPGLLGETCLVDGTVRAAGTDCSLERLYVRSSARRQGLGTSLTQVVYEHARRMGRTGVELWSDKKLVEAHRLYRSLGALPIGERICHDPDQSPEWGFVQILHD